MPRAPAREAVCGDVYKCFLTRQGMENPHFCNCDLMTAFTEKRDKEVRAGAFREAARLFEENHWAAFELRKMATAEDGIASDGFPVGGVEQCPRCDRTSCICPGDYDEAADKRRAPVQADYSWRGRPTTSAPRRGKGFPGTVTWAEHLEAWTAYARRFPGQDAERIAERGGFSYLELVDHLGHEPKTWEPRE